MDRVRAPAILLMLHHPSGTLGEVVHGVEDRPDEMFSILSALSRPGGCRFQETLDSHSSPDWFAASMTPSVR